MDRQQPSKDADTDSSARDAELIDAARREVEEAESIGLEGDNLVKMNIGDGNGAPESEISLPGYEIVQEIHRGSQGVVYKAVQVGTRQVVAIKVMREGQFSGSHDRARFDREIMVLGQLRHPNIVTIHDTGSFSGNAYFVMDYVAGQPLDVYVASGKRGVREVLILFEKMCDAVNAAHLRGVIHRDLKPGNIRVDENGEPYVLDFGLAKVAASEDELARMTVSGQFIGSLPWASPEQAEGIPGKIDVRTDVYSLGMILFGMLTGDFPYQVVGPMRDVLDRIITEEPSRPSSIRREIDSDVDTVVLKCLSKAPERRYQSAGELGRDIRHYLNGEPIEARRDSSWYVFRKSLRRHKVKVSVVALFMILVAGFGVGMSLMYRKARSEANTANQVLRFLQTTILSADPMSTDQNGGTLRDLLDRSSERLDENEIQSALARATVHLTLGQAYFGLRDDDVWVGHLEKAIAIRRELLGDDHPDTVEAEVALVRGWGPADRLKRAEPILQHAAKVQRQLPIEDRMPLTTTLNSLSLLLRRQGRLEEAEHASRECLALCREVEGHDSPKTAVALVTLAVVLQEEGLLNEAEKLCREAYSIALAVHGPEHAFVTEILFDYVTVLSKLGNHRLAIRYGEEGLAIRRKVYGDDHIMTAEMLQVLGQAHIRDGDAAGAEPLLARACEVTLKWWGCPTTLLAWCRRDLSESLRMKGDFTAAESAAREAVAIYQEKLGDDHIWTADAKLELGRILMATSRFEEAEQNLMSARDVYKRHCSEKNDRPAEVAEALATLYKGREK